MWAGTLGALGVSFVILDRLLHLGQYYALVSGLGLIVTVLANPVGIAGKVHGDARQPGISIEDPSRFELGVIVIFRSHPEDRRCGDSRFPQPPR